MHVEKWIAEKPGKSIKRKNSRQISFRLCYDSSMKDFTVLIRKEGNTYVSLCPVTLVSSYGDTEEEAIEHHKEAMELFLEDMSEEEIQEITVFMSPVNISSVQISLAR